MYYVNTAVLDILFSGNINCRTRIFVFVYQTCCCGSASDWFSFFYCGENYLYITRFGAPSGRFIFYRILPSRYDNRIASIRAYFLCIRPFYFSISQLYIIFCTARTYIKKSDRLRIFFSDDIFGYLYYMLAIPTYKLNNLPQ